MAMLLRVQTSATSAAYCALNVNERLPVTDEGGTPVQVVNVPDTTASLGGQLKVFAADGVSFFAVPYTQQGGGAGAFPVVGVLDQLIGPTPGEAGQGRAS